MTKEILLTQGKIALVDDGDYEYLMQWKWNAHKHRNTWYAKYNKTFSSVKMHRLIMNAPAGVQVDHINGDGLDNRRENLRLCTHIENMHNSGKHKNNTSGFKGVHWNKQRQTYQVFIMVNRKHKYVGSFSILEEAAHAYDEAAKEHYGEFARLNFQ